jgi:hypothetical protein
MFALFGSICFASPSSNNKKQSLSSHARSLKSLRVPSNKQKDNFEMMGDDYFLSDSIDSESRRHQDAPQSKAQYERELLYDAYNHLHTLAQVCFSMLIVYCH